MLKQVLEEIQAAPGPIDLEELSRRLGIERSAVEGMIGFWIRKGRLGLDADSHAATLCDGQGCRSGCQGPQDCPFVMPGPRIYHLISEEER